MKKLASAVCVIAAILTISACAPTDEGTTVEIFAMDTYMTITAYGENAELALAQAKIEIEALDAMLSVTNPDSAVYKYNNGAETSNAVVEELLERARIINWVTDGAYNVNIYPVVAAWGFFSGEYRVPGIKELSGMLKRTDQIDFGGLAKGYAADRIVGIMHDNEINSAIISLSGNIYAVGGKTSSEPWRIAVQDPHDMSQYSGLLLLKNISAVTSGDYQRYFEKDGVKYHHIIDPETGYPADSNLASVTVVCMNSTFADGMSTGLFVLGYERSLEIWREYPQLFDLVLIKDDGTITITKGLEGRFESERDFTVAEYGEISEIVDEWSAGNG